jgi:hypothetical protein
MPTLPLYDSTARPDQWHRVIAPGGYEWWCFEATNSTGDVRVRFDVFDGDPFNPAYRSAYARYRRRPTRMAPPVPRDYPAARLTILNKPASEQRIDAAPAAGAFEATASLIRVGPAAIAAGPNASSCRVLWGGLLDLMFRPVDKQDVQTQTLESDDPATVHFRNIIGTSFEVVGTLRGVEFHGRGRHDHFFGTGPMSAKKMAAFEEFGGY